MIDNADFCAREPAALIMQPLQAMGREMNANAKRLLAVMERAELTKDDAMSLLHIAPATFKSWFRPDTGKAARGCPLWAVELLTYKTDPRAEAVTRSLKRNRT